MKRLLMCVFLLWLPACASGTSLLSKQQFQTRHAIDSCATFDCKALERQADKLQEYIGENRSPVVIGIQQSIVTSIARRCNDDYTIEECREFTAEMKRLSEMLEQYDKK